MPEPFRGAFESYPVGSFPADTAPAPGGPRTHPARVSLFMEGETVNRTPEQLKSREKQQELVDQFNKKNPVGTKVQYTLSDKPKAKVHVGYTSLPAELLGGHTATVMLVDVRGAIPLCNVKAAHDLLIQTTASPLF